MLLALPLVWTLRAGDYDWSLVIALAAGGSDAVDGWLAKRYGWQTRLGGLLDPVADKLLLLAVLVTFGILPPRYFPLWFTVVILSRDAVLLLGYFVLRHFRHTIEIKPHWSGKLSTFFVFLAIAAVLFQAGVWITRLCALGAFFALISTAVYVRRGLQLLNEAGHTQPVTNR